MDSEVIKVGLWPTARTTRIVAVDGRSETILRATLSLRPSNLRAVTMLFEALALWEGLPVRAALVADASSMSRCPTTLYQETFAVFGDRSALYELAWVSRAAGRRRDVEAAGSFSALERLLRMVLR
jgi:hypothetical protein